MHNTDALHAAEELAQAFGKLKVTKGSKLPPDGLAYLKFEHPAVQELGLTKEIAEKLGVGYASRGILSKRVCFPLRARNGALIAYVGYALELEPALKFPVNFL